MDPNTAYRDMMDLLKAGDYSEAYDVATGLMGWLRNGGFLPTGFATTTSVPSAQRRQLIVECQQVIDVAARYIEV